MVTRKEIFVNGILGYDFNTVYEVLGADEAVEWGWRCERMNDFEKGGKVYPLTDFPFQITYAEWKENNQL